MVCGSARPLAAVDLMKLYGKINFIWHLRTDQLTWNGPINKLFGSDIPLSTGSSFLTRLTPSSFWKRFKEIDQAKGDEYTTSYMVTLPNQQKCNIVEKATLIKNTKGLPERLEGSICIEDHTTHNIEDYSGYDRLTGFPSREVLLETLSCLAEQTKGEVAPGGYLVVCIDKLSLIYFLYGLDALQESLSQVAKNLKKFTRFNDTIGRISGCCFGSVLKDTDEWGIFQAVSRLVDLCSSLKVETKVETFSPTISIGGSAFRTGTTPIEIIRQAEQSLFEIQNMKGTGIAVSQKKDGKMDIQRPADARAGERRIADTKNMDKKSSKTPSKKEAI